jgi:coniferyl-aldehyde dehydrogenase
VVAPWNYPYQLSMLPAVAALSAGNRVMIKPSEVTPRTAELMARIVADTFGDDEIVVFPGDAAMGKAFVELPFDHLFFTGSTAVGRLVAQAAAKNLTPSHARARRQVAGDHRQRYRFREDHADGCNRQALQCRPDMHRARLCAGASGARAGEFAAEMERAVAKLYPTLARNRDYSSIVNDRHYARLTALVDDARASGAKIIEINPAGEKLDRASRKIAPTLVLDAGDDTAIAREGNLRTTASRSSATTASTIAIRYVNARPRPLALYWFGDRAAHRERVLHGTLAGGVTINGCLTHFAQEAQPFGGVGDSGYGTYHGEYGFRTFSKEKPVYYQSRLGLLPLLLPPYGRRLDAVLGWFKQGRAR